MFEILLRIGVFLICHGVLVSADGGKKDASRVADCISLLDGGKLIKAGAEKSASCSLTKQCAALLGDHKDDQGKTALMYAVSNSDEKCQKSARDMIDNGANLNTADNDGKTAFMYALGPCNQQTVQMMLNRNVDINQVDNLGKQSLMYTSRCKWDAVQYLVNQKDPHLTTQDNDGWTPLMWALDNTCDKAQLTVDPILMGNKDAAKLRNNKDQTALMIAAQRSCPVQTFKDLIAVSDVSAKDKDGKTAVQYAIDNCDHFASYNRIMMMFEDLPRADRIDALTYAHNKPCTINGVKIGDEMLKFHKEHQMK